MNKRKIKKQVVTIASNVKSNYKAILITIASFIALYGIIYIATRQPQMPANLQATIDSLTAVNKALVIQQKQLDSNIHIYETKVEKVDNQINNIKEKTTIIKEYYHEQSQQVDNYDATQIDSFFKARYNY